MPSGSASSGRYAKYKQKTDALVGWLARKASQCCNITTIATIVPSLAQPRGKASAQRKSIELGTAQLLQLAEAITAVKPPVFILPETLELVKEIIDLRQMSAEEHAADSMKRHNALTTDDEGHQYFIEVLKRILVLLESVYAAGATAASVVEKAAQSDDYKSSNKKKGKSKKSKTAAETDITNLVDKLDLGEDHEEMPADDIEAASIRTARTEISHIDFKLEQQAGELTFSLLCHLQDLHDVRKMVCESAIKHSRGDKSSLAIGMYAEVAFALLKRADDAFCISNPTLDTYDKILEFLGLEDTAVAFASGPKAYSFLANRANASSKRHLEYTGDLVQLLCPAGAQLLNTHLWSVSRFAKNLGHKVQGTPMESPSLFETVFVEMHPLAAALSQSVGRLLLSHPLGPKGFRLDEFASELGTPQDRSTWLVVACQTYMDLVDISGLNCKTGLALVNDSLSQLEKIPASRKDTTPAFREPVKQAYRTLNLETEAFDRGDVGSPEYQKQRKLIQANLNCFVVGMERKLPTQAAASAFVLKSHTHLCATKAANDSSFSIHSAAYLYKVARRLGLLQSEWHDMEFFISTQAWEKPLVPKLSSSATVGQYQSAFEASIGINLAAYLRLGKVPKTDAAFKNAKKIAMGGRFISQLMQTQTDPAARGEVRTSTGKTFEIILHQMASDEAQKAAKAPLVGRNSMLRESFTPKELLLTFDKAMIREEPILNFDLLEFWRVCRQLMAAIRDALKDCLGSISTGVDAVVTLLILSEAQAQDKTGILPETAMIHRAVELFSPHISSRGNELSKKAYNQSSGHIPKHLRPQMEDPVTKLKGLRARHADQLISGGTTVGFSGRIISLYHPELTSADMQRIDYNAGEDTINLPSYMFGPDVKAVKSDNKGDEDVLLMPWDPSSAVEEPKEATKEATKEEAKEKAKE